MSSNADSLRDHMAVGIVGDDQDVLLERNAPLHRLLDQLRVAHASTVLPGAGHGDDEKLERSGVGHLAYFRRAPLGVAKHCGLPTSEPWKFVLECRCERVLARRQRANDATRRSATA